MEIVRSFQDALVRAEPRPAPSAQRDAKKNYAERLSRGLSTLFANALRPWFDGILPNEDGTRQESRARTSKGVKKLDVNYSTPELGLGLGVSIKTLNFRDPASKRYTKNLTRIDNELRAEAMDYHVRQPFAVLVAVLFIPSDACEDGKKDKRVSSFGAAVEILRHRSGRLSPHDDAQLFEGCFIGLYDYTGPRVGEVEFFDVGKDPPMTGRPSNLLGLSDLVREVVRVYDDRNASKRVRWVDQPVEPAHPAIVAPAIEPLEDEYDE